ncbi:ModD protein [Hydrogenophaga sp.]|uniref:ModD protein n=1 Tax=Hydrogenophaga sp. TaxID=1904254 RepID=UPI0035B13D6E
MMHFTQAEIDGFILEDLPVHDETVRAIRMPDLPGSLTYSARHGIVVAGVRPCVQLARSLGLEVEVLQPDGSVLASGGPVLRLHGRSHALHVAWKQGMNLLEHLSGVASTTAAMLGQARSVRPGVQLAATRKALPGSRRLLQYAVMCGGGTVHRAGLSESILLFQQHRVFIPDESVDELVRRARSNSPEKFVLVEASGVAEALLAADSGADGVQIDKMSPAALAGLVPRLRAIRPELVIAAAGGVRPDNVVAYAATGVDVLVTSSLYGAPPADFSAVMERGCV